MAEVILAGNESSGSGSIPAERANLSKWTAVESGTAKHIRVYGTGGGKIKAAIYADSAGAPGALLVASAEVTAETSAWTEIAISDTTITDATDYWIGVANELENGYTSSASSGGTRKYKTITYSGYSFPDPAGTGWSDGSAILCFAVWGDLAVGGWANIAKINGVASADIAKINGVVVANIAKVNGVAV